MALLASYSCDLEQVLIYNPHYKKRFVSVADIHCKKNLVILTTVLVISVADMPGGDSYNILCFTMSEEIILLLLAFPLK